MARCPECRRSFATIEDEDDGQHGCPYCGYGEARDEPLTDAELMELADAGFDTRHRMYRRGR